MGLGEIGDNFAKVALLFKFMNLGMVSQVQFERIQAVPTIMGYWERLSTATVQQLQGKKLVPAGKHCTETVNSFIVVA